MKKTLTKMGFLILSVVGIAYFCNFQTKGFRFQEILSDIPNNPAWEVDLFTDEQHKSVLQMLNQKFRYLGSGEQSHAFLGEDQKTVLKFFRHNDLSLLKFLKRFGSIDDWLWRFITKYDARTVFDSCKLAYEELKAETALSYLHINKTEGLFNPVVLVDNSWVAHQVDLDQTEFMVQDYCELATSRIDLQMKKGDLKAAQKTVESLALALREWTERGFHFDNPCLKRNIGFFEEKVIMLDVGSASKKNAVMTADELEKELKHLTHDMGRWIDRNHPELTPYFNQKLDH